MRRDLGETVIWVLVSVQNTEEAVEDRGWWAGSCTDLPFTDITLIRFHFGAVAPSPYSSLYKIEVHLYKNCIRSDEALEHNSRRCGEIIGNQY